MTVIKLIQFEQIEKNFALNYSL